MANQKMHPFELISETELAVAHVGRLKGFDEGLQYFLDLYPASTDKNASEGDSCPCLPWNECQCSQNGSV